MNKYVKVQRLPEVGTKFKVGKSLQDTINDPNRTPGAFVAYERFAPGSGGDLWICRHDDGKLVRYWADELEDFLTVVR